MDGKATADERARSEDDKKDDQGWGDTEAHVAVPFLEIHLGCEKECML
jgi:hypothetical protein